MIDGLTRRGAEYLEGKFYDWSSQNCLSISNRLLSHGNTLNRIIREGQGKRRREGWKTRVHTSENTRGTNIFIKKLDSSELQIFPSKRFINSLNLNAEEFYGRTPNFPRVFGTVYNTDIINLLAGKAQGYVISEFIPGKSLMQELKQGMEENSLNSLMVLLRMTLEDLRNKGIYHMDFAPRDIVINRDEIYPKIKLVDAEHINYLQAGGQEPDLLEKQIEQFNEDYSPFFNKDKLNQVRRIVFN